MQKEITSTVLGKLTQDERFSDWWVSEKIEIPFLDNNKLAITFMDFEPEHDLSYIREADQALTNFLRLDNNYRSEISRYAYLHCQDFISAVGEDDVDEVIREMNEQDVWKFIHFREILVSRRHRRDQDIYIILAGGCDWEEEHGFQLVFRQGKKLTRVSDQDGHLTEADAYNKPDENDKLLSAF